MVWADVKPSHRRQRVGWEVLRLTEHLSKGPENGDMNELPLS